MARESTAMSDAEIRAFLQTVEWVALGVLDAQGAPAAGVAPAVVSGDRLVFAVPADSPLAAALTRDPRCCASADVYPTYFEIRGATVHGRAERLASDPSLQAALEDRARRHGIATGPAYALPLLEDAFGFDFGKITRR
jgi:nitroimidazol reductase NimA-like FMN-containing flavoprotein (pyridoxamine 5'-phosphate oxidase superfamily)